MPEARCSTTGTVARLGERSFRMTAAEPNLRWLEDNARGLDVAIEDVSESLAALSLQGPGVARDPGRHRPQVFPPRRHQDCEHSGHHQPHRLYRRSGL
jgi:glycine cleavage system aminomethyltransferase T